MEHRTLRVELRGKTVEWQVVMGNWQGEVLSLSMELRSYFFTDAT